MPGFDESDSESDASQYHTTSVLLGYATKEPTDETISAIGGQPTWLDAGSPPSAALARCSVCHDLMAQLLQLHADLPGQFPTHQRRLHVFACRRRTCARKTGSVRALRTSRASVAESPASAAAHPATSSSPLSPPKPKPEPPRDLGGSIFGGGSGGGGKLFGAPPPLATKPVAADSGDLPATFASKAQISAVSPPTAISYGPAAPLEPWPKAGLLPQPYTISYLDADYEELDPDFSSAPVPNTVSLKFDTSSGPDEGGGGGGADADAALAESNLDRTFQRFADRLAQNPEQVLRYEFRGMPMLYSKTDAVGRMFGHAAEAQQGKVSVLLAGAGAADAIPACRRCGAARVFEVQLVPHAILELEAQAEEENDAMEVDKGKKATGAGSGSANAAAAAALEGMEWATILVGVCSQDCAGAPGESTHVEEWAGVQWEEQKR